MQKKNLFVGVEFSLFCEVRSGDGLCGLRVSDCPATTFVGELQALEITSRLDKNGRQTTEEHC